MAEDVSLGLWLLDEEEDVFFKNYPCLCDLQEKMTTIGSKQRRLEKLATRALLFEMTNSANLHFNHNDSGKPQFGQQARVPAPADPPPLSRFARSYSASSCQI